MEEIKKVCTNKDNLCLEFVLMVLIQSWIDIEETKQVLNVLIKYKKKHLNLGELSMETIKFLENNFDFTIIDFDRFQIGSLNYYLASEYLYLIPFGTINRVKKYKNPNSFLKRFPKIYNFLLFKKNKKFLERKLKLERFVQSILSKELAKITSDNDQIKKEYDNICEKLGVFPRLSQKIYQGISKNISNVSGISGYFFYRLNILFSGFFSGVVFGLVQK